MSVQQKTYNYRICRGRLVVEIAYGQLKTRWRRLIQQINDMIVRNVANVIAACCTLYNICEIHGDKFNDEWLEDVENEKSNGDQPTTNSTRYSGDGDEIRELCAKPTVIHLTVFCFILFARFKYNYNVF